jgi:hypothetical protein
LCATWLKSADDPALAAFLEILRTAKPPLERKWKSESSFNGTAILGIALATMKSGSDADKNVCKTWLTSFLIDSL